MILLLSFPHLSPGRRIISDYIAVAFDDVAEPDDCGLWLDPMPYEKPRHTFNQIDKAGKSLFGQDVPTEQWAEAVKALWGWRATHSYPLTALHMTVRNRARSVDQNVTTAQRLKRIESVFRKLMKRRTMQMSQMQVIGDCRTVPTVTRNGFLHR